MSLLRTIVIDGVDVEIDSLSDEIVIEQLRLAEASMVAAALGDPVKNWNDRAQKTWALAKLRSLRDAVRKRKLQVA